MSTPELRVPFLSYYTPDKGAVRFTFVLYLYQPPSWAGSRYGGVIAVSAEGLSIVKCDSFKPADLSRFCAEFQLARPDLEFVRDDLVASISTEMSDVVLSVSAQALQLKVRHGNRDTWQVESTIDSLRGDEFLFNPQQIQTPYSDHRSLVTESREFVRICEETGTAFIGKMRREMNIR